MLAGRDILLLDEPTNHLDLEAVLWMERYLAGFGGILLFTAHDRCFLDRVATHVLSLGDDTPHLWKGSFSGFEVWREEKKKLRQREAERIEEEINRKQAFVDRFRYKATKATQAQSRVLQIDKLRKELLLVAPGREQRNLSFSWPTPEDSGKKVISLVDLGYSFSDGTILWKDVNCSIPKGRKIALLGPNGKGKSTLMKTIAGRAEASSGHIEFGPRTVTGYFSQHQSETLNLENSVLTEIRRLSHPHTTEEELRSVLGLFLLPEPFWDRKTADLSGGEKNKLVLASLFLTRANFLLLDEPTNHLDLESREALCAALSAFQGAVLLISHDRHLLSRVAQELWVIKDKSMSLLDCSIENYLKELEEQADRSARLSKPSRGKKTGTREDTRKYEAEVRNRFYRKLKPLQAEYAELEMRLDSTLSEQESRESLLADPKVYNDPHRLAELNREYSSIQEEGEGLMNRLSELEEKIRHVEAERDSLLGLSPS
ncbi:MAG: ABC-F family ATP-binding cassette domain-containing protein [Desulfovibrionales bacterium]